MMVYIFFRIAVAFTGLIPYPILYKISNGIAWIMRAVIGYRRDVVKQNLDYIFPDMPKEEVRTITKAIYRNLTDVILESLKSYTMSIEDINRRYLFKNKEELSRHYDAGKDITILGGHYNNWEWGTLSCKHQLPFHVVALIKPLKNKKVHDYMIKGRSRIGTELVSIYSVKKSALHTPGKEPKAIVFVADQNPSRGATALDVTFLGKPTKALPGGEAYARKYRTPVYWMEVTRVKRGYYTVTPTLITEEPRSTERGEITNRYLDCLSAQIIDNPGNWLWTHKRWKNAGIYNK